MTKYVMEKYMFLKLCLALTMVFGVIKVNAQYTLTDDDVEVVNGVLRSCSYDFTIKDITIPEVLDGQTVIAIGRNAFSNKALTSVDLPNSVISIGGNAFSSNRIADIVIPDGVKYINERAFTSNYPANIVIPNSVTYLGEAAFANMFVGVYDTILTNVSIGNSVSDIGKDCFSRNHMTDIIIPNSVTYIGEAAFLGCELHNIELGNGVEYIGRYAFGWNKLTSINIPNSVTTIDISAFSSNRLTNIDLGYGVKYVGNQAFSDNYLTRVTIPNNVSIIANGAFWENRLNHIDLGDSVTYLGAACFKANYLTHVEIPNSVTYIGGQAFFENYIDSFHIPLAHKQDSIFLYWNDSIPGNSEVHDLLIAYNAFFTASTYTVTFMDWDSTLLQEQMVEYGGLATAPVDPSRDGYIFTGWDFDFTNVIANMHLTAQYTQISSTNDINNQTLSIYPNPVSDILHVQSFNDSAISRINIYNLSGDLVYTKHNVNQSHNIDLSKHNSGTLLINILYKDGNCYSQKMFKQ